MVLGIDGSHGILQIRFWVAGVCLCVTFNCLNWWCAFIFVGFSFGLCVVCVVCSLWVIIGFVCYTSIVS